MSGKMKTNREFHETFISWIFFSSILSIWFERETKKKGRCYWDGICGVVSRRFKRTLGGGLIDSEALCGWSVTDGDFIVDSTETMPQAIHNTKKLFSQILLVKAYILWFTSTLIINVHTYGPTPTIIHKNFELEWKSGSRSSNKLLINSVHSINPLCDQRYWTYRW